MAFGTSDRRRLQVTIVSDSESLKKDFRDVRTESDKTGRSFDDLSRKAGKAFASKELPDQIKQYNRLLEKTQAQIAIINRQTIKVDVDDDKPNRFFRSFASKADKLGDAFDGFATKINPLFLAAGIAAAAVFAPAFGAAATAGILTFIGGGIIAAGIKAAADDPKVKSAWETFKTNAKSAFKDFGKPFVTPLIETAKIFGEAVKRLAPAINGLGETLAPVIVPLAKGLVSMAEKALPGIKKAAEAAKPLLDTIGNELLPAIGDAIKAFLEEITKSGSLKGMTTFVKDVAAALPPVFRLVGQLIGFLAKTYTNFHDLNVELFSNIKGSWREIVTAFNWVKDKITAAVNWIKNVFISWRDRVSSVITTIRTTFNNFVDFFGRVRDKISGVLDKVKTGFSNSVTAIKKAWDGLKKAASDPVRFLVDTVYNNGIRNLWNTIAGKFGMGNLSLPVIKPFARGGSVPGKGNKDTVPAMLTPGEGILTVKEMAALGGPGGFNQFRAALAQFHNGGIVGGDGIGDRLRGFGKSLLNKGKDIIQGIAGPVVSKLIAGLRPIVGGIPGNGLGTLLRGGANKALDGLLAFVKRKDSEIPAGGAGMGYRAMQALIGKVFPSLGMISGFRPGATTLSGNRSYHALGRAVDYPAVKALAQWIYRSFGSRSKEIITPWQEFNVHNGKRHNYTGAVWNQHNFAGGNAHVHWAMDGVTDLAPGLNIGMNRTGKTERVVNTDLLNQQPVVININNYGVGNMSELDVKKIRDSVVKLASRNGGRSGLPA